MARNAAINLFYEQPDPDRWIRYDRYPRRILRRLIRGKPRLGGHDLVFFNLKAGLNRLGIRYRVNDYRYIRRNPTELACVVGKQHVVEKIPSAAKVLFGAAQFSHPHEQPGFFDAHQNIWKVLVPSEWVRRMWEPFFGERVQAWPTGIDTEKWKPRTSPKELDFVIYDKIYRDRENLQRSLISPVMSELSRRGMSFETLRYGSYAETDYDQLLSRTRAMIFLCEHETQGLAYQQALASGVPIFAYDRGGLWTDPNFYPRLARFEPVTSVPYWDDRCGMKFNCSEVFVSTLPKFIERMPEFHPREYILDNLTLEKCAAKYVEFVRQYTAGV